MDGLQPQTEREIILMMASNLTATNTKMDNLTGAVEKLATTIEKLETNKIGSIERRIEKLEKWHNESSGVVKFIPHVSLVLGIIVILLQLFKHG
jgi:hypothetical protein